MRKIVILLLGLPFIVSAQINTLKIKEDTVATFPKVKVKTTYDSLETINFSNYNLHIKQTLYLPELSERKYEGGFQGFFVKANDEVSYRYKRSNKASYLSDYDALANKYFYVNDIITSERGSKFLQLIKKDVGDTLYFYLEANKKDFFTHFITVGYFEKMKSLYVGKEFVYISEGSTWEAKFYNIKDNKEKFFNPGTRFKCVDIVALDYVTLLEAVMRNSEGDFTVSLKSLPSKINEFRTPSEYESEQAIKTKQYENEQAIKAKQFKILKAALIKKYGATNGALIAKNHLKIGFTKQMCKESWGEPDDINITTTIYGSREQWVYSSNYKNSYLYFENGRLTSIQN